MPFAIILRGPAGTGKSEISSQLKKDIPNLIHLDIDSFKHIISKDSSTIRSDIAHSVGSHFIKELTKNKFNIIIEEIFREEYYFEIIKILKKNNYKILKVFITASKEILIKRDKKRLKNKGAKVISQILKEIKPLNEDLIIDTTNRSISQVKRIILYELKAEKII
jgi:adenylylsulfate kinase-like enzyme